MHRTVLDFLKFTFGAPDSFQPRSAEEQFLDDYAKRFLAHRRAISILAVVYWSAYTFWDIAQASQSDQFKGVLTPVLTLRLLGVVGLAACAWLTFQKSFANERYATGVLIATVTIPYVLLGLMLLLVPFPINYMYYSPGLFEVMIFTYGMFRLRARPAIRLTLAFLVFSELVYAFMANDVVNQSGRVFSPYYFVVIGLTALLCWLAAVFVVMPIRSVTDTVVRFGQGDMSARTYLLRQDEIGWLARSFNDMAERLEGLLVSERRLLEDISHELRSPLARMKLAIKLARTSTDPGAALDRVEGILAAGQWRSAVAGGVALAAYGNPRVTLDLDIVTDAAAQPAVVAGLEAAGYRTLFDRRGGGSECRVQSI